MRSTCGGTPALEGHIEWVMSLGLQPLSILQEEQSEGMLAGLEGDLQRARRPVASGDRIGGELKLLPLGYPVFDVV